MSDKLTLPQFAELIRPKFQFEAAERLLSGYDDQNLLVRTHEGRVVIKLTPDSEAGPFLEAQTQILQRLTQLPVARPLPLRSGKLLEQLQLPDGSSAWIRALSYLEGELLGERGQYTPGLLRSVGTTLGQLDQQLANIDLLAIRQRYLSWDLRHALSRESLLACIPVMKDRRVAAYFFQQFRDQVLPLADQLPRQTIHSDANDWNIVVKGDSVAGLIDFGDMVHTWRICELGIALAYLMMDQEDPLRAAAEVISAYHAVCPLREVELKVLPILIAARLCVSVSNSAKKRMEQPEEAYLFISEAPAWRLLHQLIAQNPRKLENTFRRACQLPDLPSDSLHELMDARNRRFSSSMSISYRAFPLQMERAALQYMYAADGRTYLDGVNNIMHVGHCHPRVVRAAQTQIARLNTNTRYLYPLLSAYADRLTQTLPDGLEKVFFVNSGSAASDMALRLARTHTQNEAVLVLEHGYHGNTAAGIAVSAYKYRGKGGQGPEKWIVEAPLPDLLRQSGKSEDAIARDALAEVAARLERNVEKGQPVGAFIGESIVGCGGQVVLPEGYLAGIYARVRAGGGVCIADEVQTGFGRVGTHFWAFEQHGVVPDIVVLGKPMGNGHPIGAVVCTQEIADSFANGMEFFSSFGGNPVSCAIGNEVLRVIEEEGMQAHALKVGEAVRKGWEALKTEFPVIGDVRGSGLFLGLELVRPGDELAPDGDLADELVMAMRQRGILLSTDGPYHNVIKFKPPLPFSLHDAARMNEELRNLLKTISRP
jgi:ethanolamine-phosphate phospho-lyase